jgi:hypothetical protein
VKSGAITAAATTMVSGAMTSMMSHHFAGTANAALRLLPTVRGKAILSGAKVSRVEIRVVHEKRTK